MNIKIKCIHPGNLCNNDVSIQGTVYMNFLHVRHIVFNLLINKTNNESNTNLISVDKNNNTGNKKNW